MSQEQSQLEYLLTMESQDQIIELLTDIYTLSKTGFNVTSINQVPLSFKHFKNASKISEKNLKELFHK